MLKISEDIVHFFQKQGFVIVSSVDEKGCPHNSCKGIVHIDPNGTVWLLDLYRSRTFNNLKRSPRMSVTAVNEHKFSGYSLKGKARIVETSDIKSHIISAWEQRIASRLTKRVMKEIKEGEGHPHYPEAALPHPEYMLIMDVDEIVDLTPQPMKVKGRA